MYTEVRGKIFQCSFSRQTFEKRGGRKRRDCQETAKWFETCRRLVFRCKDIEHFLQNGSLLLAQIFSEDPVQQIRCRTYERPRHTADAEKVCNNFLVSDQKFGFTIVCTSFAKKKKKRMQRKEEGRMNVFFLFSARRIDDFVQEGSGHN